MFKLIAKFYAVVESVALVALGGIGLIIVLLSLSRASLLHI